VAGNPGTASKPRLLYLSPVVPALSGNGLAMRAGMVLQLLAQRYSVSLVVVQLYAPYGVPIPAEIAGLCRDTVVLPTSTTTTWPAPSASRSLPKRLGDALRTRRSLAGHGDEEAIRAFPGVPFDVVHVFRLAMAPFARPYFDRFAPPPERHLDLDDVESSTRRRLAALYRLNGNAAMARLEELEAQRSELLETEALRDFDRVYVCSPGDQKGLARLAPARVCVLPNALPLAEPLPPKRRDGLFTLLFVGTLGYYPNEDAIRHLCVQVLPLLRATAQQAFRVAIVGTGATAAIRQLAELPEVQLIGAVADVAPWYREADAVVVPIRAGGGTRIKVLEAFRYGRPVVSTSMGIEGIEARGDEHVLLGDTPLAFAEQCRRLMGDQSFAESLTQNAYALFKRAYTTEVVARSLAAMCS